MRIKVLGIRPIWIGNRKIEPGEEVEVDKKLVDKSNRHIRNITQS